MSDSYFNIKVQEQNTLDPNIVNENIIKNKIIVYPNPSDETITIEWDNTINPNEIGLIDMKGNEIKYFLNTEKIYYYKINISNFDSGSYFIKIYLRNGEFIIKKVILL
ncbi:MAG: T9SS type A sorting domain-containing protein [bacterium]